MVNDRLVLICCHLLEGSKLERVYHSEKDDWFFLCERGHSCNQVRALDLTEVMERFKLTEGNLISVPLGYLGHYHGMYWTMTPWSGDAEQIFLTLNTEGGKNR